MTYCGWRHASWTKFSVVIAFELTRCRRSKFTLVCVVRNLRIFDTRHELADRATERSRIDGHRERQEADTYTPAVFFITALTSALDTRSGAVQPFRSYSAMHCSANPL